MTCTHLNWSKSVAYSTVALFHNSIHIAYKVSSQQYKQVISIYMRITIIDRHSWKSLHV